MKISVLEDHVINRIAAGEVIERPASVVRELVDNAIDAEASEVGIWVEGGGRTLIRITDNGFGMERDDALLAFERHATSKLKSDTDLSSILTMGFRGEALASIAAVSKARLITRTECAPVGTEIVIQAGKLKEVNELPAPVGTSIEVRNLFFNVPARRKFLKQPRTEQMRIKQWIKNSALAHPMINYRFFADDKEQLSLGKKDSSLDRAKALYKGSYVSIDHSEAGVSIEGMLAHPSLAQSDASALSILVNGRVISDRMLMRAIRDGFDSTLKAREYPVGFYSLVIDPALVDVNVHPQKSEVRFSYPNQVFQLVRKTVLDAVKGFQSPMEGFGTKPESFRSFVPQNRGKEDLVESFAVDNNSEIAKEQVGFNLRSLSRGESCSENMQLSEPVHSDSLEAIGNFKFSNLRYIGQLLECYLLCEHAEKFYIVDMHAAHERFNFNKIRNSFRVKDVNSQQLLVPLTITLTEELLANCLDHQELLATFGFEIEEFGPDTLLIRSVPTMIATKDPTRLIKEIAACSLAESAEGRILSLEDEISARLACHASIRSGKRMKTDEVYALFDALDQSEFSSACPHGRPVVVSFSEQAIERWFGRDR